jgi:hypothetical protein
MIEIAAPMQATSLVFYRVRELNRHKLMRGGADIAARTSWQNIFW